MIDEWGGIDKNVQNIVTALNNAGFQTTGSCEEHINRDAPTPWIKINATKRLQEKMIKLLDKFYLSRVVPHDIRIVISEANFGFYLHNGGATYDKWRKEVQKTAAQITNNEITRKESLSDEEKEIRAKKLPTYHKELEVFAEFLNKNN